MPKEITNEQMLVAVCKDIANYLKQARSNVVTTVNRELITAYGRIGKRIYDIEQDGQVRAAYGEEILVKLSARLTKDLGRGFSVTNLRYFRQFYLAYQDRIHHKACDEFNIALSWSHYRLLIQESRANVRSFYEIEAADNNWSTKELKRQMGSLLYERLAKSRDKEGVLALGREGQVINNPVDVLKDPVVLEFLDIPEQPQMRETDLEGALITHLKSFLLEMGKGFAFIARQKRIIFNGDNFYPDLIFYHVILNMLCDY